MTEVPLIEIEGDHGYAGAVRLRRARSGRTVMALREYAAPPLPRLRGREEKQCSKSPSPSARGGNGSYYGRIVRYRDLSPDGLKEKVRFTTREMESRLSEFGFGWQDTTAVQAYSIHDFHPVIVDELVRRGAMRSGLSWHFARPPVIDLEYEMDCRRVLKETVI
jgi:hypothetical protein